MENGSVSLVWPGGVLIGFFDGVGDILLALDSRVSWCRGEISKWWNSHRLLFPPFFFTFRPFDLSLPFHGTILGTNFLHNCKIGVIWRRKGANRMDNTFCGIQANKAKSKHLYLSWLMEVWAMVFGFSMVSEVRVQSLAQITLVNTFLQHNKW